MTAKRLQGLENHSMKLKREQEPPTNEMLFVELKPRTKEGTLRCILKITW